MSSTLSKEKLTEVGAADCEGDDLGYGRAPGLADVVAFLASEGAGMTGTMVNVTCGLVDPTDKRRELHRGLEARTRAGSRL